MTHLLTFKEYILEERETVAIEKIAQDCQPFIEASGREPLYRGYGGTFSNVLKRVQMVTIRKDRRPRDSSEYVHDAMDEYFVELMGVKVRSSALFATGDLQDTERYGKPHYVFPVGEFRYVWGDFKGTAVHDTISFARQIKDEMQVRPRADRPEVTKKVLDQVNWHVDKDLKAGIRSGSEIALLAEKAIIVPYGVASYLKLISG